MVIVGMGLASQVTADCAEDTEEKLKRFSVLPWPGQSCVKSKDFASKKVFRRAPC